ncbi:MAG: D-serine ammonia-lyase [Clostridiales bacterium]|nr:D-serine ammonia-lyase [Clostridiales bacterium]
MKSIEHLIDEMKHYSETLWVNPNKISSEKAMELLQKTHPELPDLEDVMDADQRLRRFAPFFVSAFPESSESNGIIESPLISIPEFQKSVIPFVGGRILGQWFLKADNLLPISGSIKARGGVYEIIKFAETLALNEGILNIEEDYSCFAEEKFKSLFRKYTIVVGSTGNLGLSIGTIGSALGFNVLVHMSHDAKAWKIDLLRSKGVTVVLHDSDYSVAVAEGRKSALSDPYSYFVDDENSYELFVGYAVAALRLKQQMIDQKIIVNADHPLFVYLPCGVGGAPGGIAYAIKLVFGDDAYVFLAEPTHAPCMMLGMATGKHDRISVGDIDIDLKTDADGLAVGRASGFVGQVLTPLIDGIYTISDDKLYFMLYIMHEAESMNLEPSALAGLIGPIKMLYDSEGFGHLAENGLLEKMEKSIHISWATGGSLVPESIMESYIKKGQVLSGTL